MEDDALLVHFRNMPRTNKIPVNSVKGKSEEFGGSMATFVARRVYLEV
jgi:hypothetical protein